MTLIVIAAVIGFVVTFALEWRKAARRRASEQAEGGPARRMEWTATDRAAHPILWRFAQTFVAVFMYVLGPLRLLRTHEIKRTGAVAPLTPADFEALAAETQSWLNTAQATLERNGFVRPARMRMDVTGSASSYGTLLEHRDHTTLGTVSVTRGEKGRTAEAILFRSEVADGTFVLTASNHVRRRFPRRPQHDAMVFPGLGPTDLLALHRFRVAQRALGKPPRVITTTRDPIAYQARELSETYDFWLRIGYYRPGAGETLRLTPKGAICLVWRAKFPWAQISDWRDSRARALVLKASGLGTGTDGRKR
jgi:hypothetical protein